MANQGVENYNDGDGIKLPPFTIQKYSISGDMVLIEKQDGESVAQNATSSGAWVDVHKFKHIVGTVDANQTGTLTISQSDDGYTTRFTTTISTDGSNAEAFDVEIVHPFVKITWTEGNTGASTLYLYAYAKMV